MNCNTRDNKKCLKLQKCLHRDCNLKEVLLLCHLIYIIEISHICIALVGSTVEEVKIYAPKDAKLNLSVKSTALQIFKSFSVRLSGSLASIPTKLNSIDRVLN